MKVRATRKGKNGRRRHDGFTLLQAIVVMTVAMIVSGATIMSIRAGRSYRVVTSVAHSQVVNGKPTVKTITIEVNPEGTSLGAVSLRAVRTTTQIGPNR